MSIPTRFLLNRECLFSFVILLKFLVFGYYVLELWPFDPSSTPKSILWYYTTKAIFILPFFYALSHLLKGKHKSIVFIGLGFSLFLVCLTSYYDYFGSLPRLWAIRNIPFALQMGPGLAHFLLKPYFFVFLSLDLLFIIFCHYLKERRGLPALSKKLALTVLVLSFLLIPIQRFVLTEKFLGVGGSITDSLRWDVIYAYRTYGFMNIALQDIVKILHSKPRHNRVVKYDHFPEVNKKYSRFPNHNLILIQVESLDYNVINRKYEGFYITPFLAKLSTESINVINYFAQHQNGTSDADFSLLTSRYTRLFGTAFETLNLHNFSTLASTLKNNGYHTVAFHGNRGKYFNRNAAFKILGFEDFFEASHFSSEGGIKYYAVNDKGFFGKVADDILSFKNPFFSYIITLTSHDPFKSLSEDEISRSFSDIENEHIKNYFESIHYVDESIRLFFHKLRKGGILEHTIVVIVGDHSSKIDDEFYRSVDFTYGRTGFEHVPFLVILPSRERARIKKLAMTIDVAPTVLNLLNFNIPHGFMGNSVFSHGQSTMLNYGSKVEVLKNDGLYRFKDGKLVFESKISLDIDSMDTTSDENLVELLEYIDFYYNF